MDYGVRFQCYRPGDRVSVWDDWLERWREATVVMASLTLVTAVSDGGYKYVDLPASPKWVRPVRIACSNGRAMRRAA